MHRRYDNINIPIELIRTLVSVCETGSFARAAAQLGLTQSAVSAQMKRLQVAAGGSLFDKTVGGVALSERGKLVRAQGLRILEANDRILALAGSDHEPSPLRIGVSTLMATDFVNAMLDQTGCNVYCDSSTEIAKGLNDGYVDVALMLHTNSDQPGCIASWDEEVCWVRSVNLIVGSESVIPLIGWHGNIADSIATRALEEAGIAYTFRFTAPDHSARLAAAKACWGYVMLPRRFVQSPLVVANDHFLPALPPNRAGIFVRQHVDMARVAPVIELLKALQPDARIAETA